MNNRAVIYLAEKKYGDALKLLRSASKKNNGRAFSNLGVCYENGWGVPRSDELAYKNYYEGLRREDAKGMCRVGIFQLLGKVERSSEQLARIALSAAAEKGDAQAKSILRILAMRGMPSKHNIGDYRDKWSMPPEAQYQELIYQREENARLNRTY